MNLPSSRTYGLWLAIVRIVTGAIWLVHGIPKFTHPERFMPPNGIIVTYVQQGLSKTVGPYHDFLANVVQPNLPIFAELVRIGEVAVGLSLFWGLFSRLGGLFGVVLAANYVVAAGGAASASAWSAINGTLLLLSAISLVLPTGRVLGLDALLAPRRVRRTVVVPEIVPERPMEGPRAPST